ncbi:hypothetical protein MsAg5_18020 [Methanosarcinaceae archaeon Ag5]|uniref:Replication factor C small subunit n=1 Tax=Methanolapillus africanus TaxID=3028297 RepID=A0AAE4MLI3_9EURY|nr:hypothetical protein [Methanosarcinaceae archaeon Ag5]
MTEKDVWTLKYRPTALEDILGNRQTVATLKSLAASGSLPHLILFGPENAGKMTAALALSKELYGESSEQNFTYFNASDFFEQGKNYLVRDPRFYRILGTDDPKKIQRSVITIFKDIINEYAGIAPIDADYKIICIDSAESLTMDAQHALRRIMEKYSKTCRFILSTKSVSKLIAPLRSRCVTLFFKYPNPEDLADYLKSIAEKENVSVTDDIFIEISELTNGNVSKSLELLQAGLIEADEMNTPLTSGMIKMQMQLEEETAFKELLDAAQTEKDFLKIREKLDALLIDVGYSGSEILEQIACVIDENEKDEKTAARKILAVADCDSRLMNAQNERIQLENLLANFD